MRISLFVKIIYLLLSPKASNISIYHIITTSDLVIV